MPVNREAHVSGQDEFHRKLAKLGGAGTIVVVNNDRPGALMDNKRLLKSTLLCVNPNLVSNGIPQQHDVHTVAGFLVFGFPVESFSCLTERNNTDAVNEVSQAVSKAKEKYEAWLMEKPAIARIFP